MQRILVTGASGYIGRHLVRSFLDDSVPVRGFARGVRPATLSGVEWQPGNVCCFSDLEQAMEGCATVVHLACLPLSQSWENPVRDFSVNARGTLNVLQAARKAGTQRIVYTSTAQVYGFARQLPLAEDSLTHPVSPYAASKLCGEVICTTFARCYGLNTVVLRLFNVYGSPADGRERSTVEAIFVRRVAQGLPPIIKGAPEEGRDFVHVSDVVGAIRLALDAEVSGEIINVGSGVLTTLQELARLVITISGIKTSPIIESGNGPPMRIQADTRKAQRVLGFQAEISLHKGLSQMLEREYCPITQWPHEDSDH